jgi:hypothetical protein
MIGNTNVSGDLFLSIRICKAATTQPPLPLPPHSVAQYRQETGQELLQVG